jgi:hypothetical protein
MLFKHDYSFANPDEVVVELNPYQHGLIDNAQYNSLQNLRFSRVDEFR